MQQLGVRPETLARFGAVSEETIREMATLVCEKFKTSIGVATSGIAGPGGATPEKPVGTKDYHLTIWRHAKHASSLAIHSRNRMVYQIERQKRSLHPSVRP